MNINSYFDDRHYQQLLQDDNDYMIPWFQSIPQTPALSHSSATPPHDSFNSNELLFSSISPQATFSDMYDIGSIVIPSDNITPMVTTSTTSTNSNSSSSNTFVMSPSTPQEINTYAPTTTSTTVDESKYSNDLMPFKKVAHNAIERRYRNNINDRIRELQQVVPALCRDTTENDGNKSNNNNQHTAEEDEMDEMEEEDGVPVAKKLNKATILQKATEYIHFLKYSQQLLKQENDMLQHMVQALPGGEPLLQQFLADKQRFDQAEKERRAKERKLALQQQRIDHQRMLKERAAQRAALMSPEERRKRRGRRSSQPKKRLSSISSASSSTSSSPSMPLYGSSQSSPQHSLSPTPSPSSSSSSSASRFFSVFLGMTFFAVPSTNPSNLVWKQHRPSASRFMSHNSMSQEPWSWSDYWPLIRFSLYCFFITYLFILPFLSKFHVRRTNLRKRIN